MELNPHFGAFISFKTMSEGGRGAEVDLRRYRPDIRFREFPSPYYGAHPWIDATDPLAVTMLPGEQRFIEFELRAAELIMDRLHVGSSFDIMEGGTAVGSGVIARVY